MPVVRLDKALTLPIAPVKVCAPVVVRFKLKGVVLSELSVELKLIAPLPVLKLLSPLKETAPKLILLFVAFTAALSVVVLAVLVKPLVKLKVSPPSPKVTPFVLLKVVAAVMVFGPEPVKLTAYPAAAVVKLFRVTFPPKLMVPVVLVKIAVFAFTAPLKIVPPLLVTVSVFKACVPIAPLTVTAPVVLKIKFEVPTVAPVTVLKLIGFAVPAPSVKVLPSAMVVAPKVI